MENHSKVFWVRGDADGTLMATKRLEERKRGSEFSVREKEKEIKANNPETPILILKCHLASGLLLVER